MSKIALINIGLHGHVNPTLAFTTELVRRGHDVLYFAPEEFRTVVERTGARFHPYSTNFVTPKGADFKNRMTSMPRRWIEDFESTFTLLLDALASERPDVLVYDFVSLPGRAIASVTGTPAVKFFTTYASNEHFDLLQTAFRSGGPILPEDIAYFDTEIAQLAARHGFPAFGFDDIMRHAEPQNLAFMPQSFQPDGETFGSAFAFVGPCIDGLAQQPLLDFQLATDLPLLYISLGTIFNDQP